LDARTLLSKIEANASRRLPIPPGRKPAEELKRYGGFLKEESARLRILHRAGAGGLDIAQARAAVMDLLIRHIFDAIRKAFPPKGKVPRLALVAYGGYGRGELNPCSDIDLMFLYEAGVGPAAEVTLGDWTSALLYALWDIGLKVGHSVRTIDDCVRLANQDMQSKTGMLESRLVAGDSRLEAQLRRRFLKECVKGHVEEYLAQRLEDQARRRSRHGDSAAMQEPNIKNGCGGLRDFQNLLWMAFFRLGYRSTAELQGNGLISARERKQLDAAHDFLLRTRNELHYTAGSSSDVLSAPVKANVASGLGYTERSARVRVEHFMRDYYTHARNVYLITFTLEQRLALSRPPAQKGRGAKTRRPVPAEGQELDGFLVVGQQLTAPSRTIFREDPNRLIRAFLYSQQRGLQIHPDLAQMLRQLVNEGRVDGAFRQDSGVHTTFLEILAQRGNVAPVLRAMHEVGFLGRLLPEFGRMTNLVQHEFYHQYAVDEHTLVTLQKLDAIWLGNGPLASNYAAVLPEIERPEVLYLALLLHDSGKAFPGRPHELVGGELALRVARRLHLDGATTHTLRLLIELHLEMVKTSQRRDLEDPAVIRQFAAEVQTQETLAMLTLHTLADSLGTSDTLWNGFKDMLLRTLYFKARNVLGGATEFQEVERRQRELLQREVTAILPRTFASDEIQAHFDGMPSRYFQIHDARWIARDLTLVHRFMHFQLTEDDRALEPALVWTEESDRGYAGVHVCTWDRAGLFAKLTGGLAAAGLNILTAQIVTRADDIVLDDFYVVDARTGEPPEPQVRQRFDRIVTDVLAKGVDPEKALAKAQKYPALYRSVGERIPTLVRVDNRISEDYTVIDVEAEDRVGLLFAIAQALFELGLDVTLAKIVTEKGAAMDTFYVLEGGRAKVTEPNRIRRIETRIREAVTRVLGE